MLGSLTAEARVVPLLPDMKPAPAPELREKFHDALARGLGSDAVSAADVRTRAAAVPEMASCTAGACASRAAMLFHAERLAVAEIEQVGKTYSIKIHVLDSDGHEVGGPVEERCDICTVREAEASVERAAAKVAPQLVVAPPPRSEPARTEAPPPRAEPSHHNAPPPSTTHSVDDHPPAVDESELRRHPAQPEKGGGQFPYRPVAYATFGLAAVSLAATIGFAVYAAKDSNPTCDAPNPRTSCPEIYHGNSAPAAMFGVLTALSAGTGVLMLVLESKRSKRTASVAAAPSAGGMTLRATFEF